MGSLRWLLVLCFLYDSAWAQVKGKITDENGTPLPFASIYVNGTTYGTNSNADGEYVLELNRGRHVLVFQYLGYETRREAVEMRGEPIHLNVRLSPSEVILSEYVVSSKRRDPAYEIIEKCIARRPYYEKGVGAFTCQAYTKGLMEILSAPKRMFGQEIGNLGGRLDSNRRGVVYLSEAVSRLRFRPPAHFEEEMLSSKISGNDNGFSFNRAGSMNFNLYKNAADFGRQIVSPIADYALSHYDYRLLSSEKIPNGNLIYKIQLIPKIREDAVWNGLIYVQENLWNIYAFEGLIMGFQIKQPLFDSIQVVQTHFPVRDPDIWHVQSQVFRFTGGFFDLKVGGNFTIVFSDYVFDTLDRGRKMEILTIAPGANERSQEYWDSIRPIPLTPVEIRDYAAKDSLKNIIESKAYKDSLDRRNNRFKGMDLLTGYTMENTFKRYYFSLGSLLEMIHFNPVQGLVLGMNGRFTHYLHRTSWHDRFSVRGDLSHGFADNRWRGSLQITRRYRRKQGAYVSWQFFNRLEEFNSASEISNLYNAAACLFWKNNQLKLYEQKGIRTAWGSYLGYDVYLQASAEYHKRESAENRTDFSFAENRPVYQPNDGVPGLNYPLQVREKEALRFKASLTWKPNTKVWILPDDIERVGSVWPKFVFDYAFNYYPGGRYGFHAVGIQVSHTQSPARWGRITLHMSGQGIFTDRYVDVPDRLYASSAALAFYNIPQGENYFLSLPLYANIGDNYAVQFFVENNFQGRLLDRIPLIRKLGFTEIIRAGTVYTPEHEWAGEWCVGLGNVGIGILRVFRLDLAYRYDAHHRGVSYLRLGLARRFNALR